MSKPYEHEAKILESKDEQPEGMKWIKLRKIKWQDQEGKERMWEAADRTTRSKGGVDAVAILALIHHPSKPTSTVIIEQYRPPVENTVIELPAGLIDEGETPEETALRELHEETGYGGGEKGGGTAEVLEVTPLLVNDPGMTGANMKLVTVKVQLKEDEPMPEPKLEPGEHIVKRLVEMRELYEVLQDYDKKGCTVDARLAHFALGWHMAQRKE